MGRQALRKGRGALRAAVAAAALTAGCATPPVADLLAPAQSEVSSAVQLLPPLARSFNVRRLTVSARSPYLASASSDATVVLWDLKSGRHVRRLTGHAWGVTAVVFHPNGETIATSAGDEIHIWNLRDGRELKRLRVNPPWTLGTILWGNDRFVSTMVFSADGKFLFVGTDSGLYQIDLISGAQIHKHRGGDIVPQSVHAIDVTGDGRYLAASAAGSVYVWDLASGAPPRRFGEKETTTLIIAFSPDGALLAGATSSGNVVVWSVENGAALGTFTQHQKTVTSLAFGADSKLVISGSKDQTARVWDAATFRQYSSKDLGGPVGGVAFAPGSGLALAAYGGVIQGWAPTTGQLQALYAYELNEVPSTLALSPDGSYALSGLVGGDFVVLDLRTGRQVRRFKASEGKAWAKAAAFGRSGHVATYMYDGNVQIWDFRTGSKLYHLTGLGEVNALEFSPDGSSLLLGTKDGVHIWNIGRQKVDQHIGGPWSNLFLGGVEAAVYSPSGRKVAVATLDSAFRAVVRDLRTNEVVNLGDLLVTQGRAISESFFGLQRSSANVLAMNAKGTRVLSGSRNGAMRLWDAGNGNELHTFPHNDPVKAVAFHPDEEHALSVSGSTLRLWDLSGRKQVWQAGGRAAPVTTALFDAKGLHVIGACDDGTWRIWDAATGRLLLTYVLTQDGHWAAFAPDGLFDGTPKAWKAIQWQFREASDAVPLEIFFEEFFRPGLLGEVLAGKRPAARRDIARLDRRQPQVEIVSIHRVTPADGGRELARVRLRVGHAPAGEGGARPSGVRDLRLFQNGARVKIWLGDLLDSRTSSREIEAEVPIVSGENSFMAYAFNSDGIKSADGTFTFDRILASPPPAKIYVVAIGANTYKHGWPRLSFARTDADQFGKAVQRYLRASGRYGEPVLIPLLEQQATYANIVNVFRRLGGDASAVLPAGLSDVAAAQPEDVVIVFFAGHGTVRGDRFHFHPYDAQPGAELANSLSDRDLEQAVQGIHVKEFAIVIDSCHSGQALGPEDLRVGPLNSKGLAQLAWEKGMTILAASQSYESAIESARYGHGLLTHALIQEGLGLDQANGKADEDPTDGRITVQEWFDFAVRRVPSLHADVVRERLQIGRERNRLLGVQSPDEQTVAVEEERVEKQQPRVFYRRQPSPEPLVVRVADQARR